MQGLNAESAKVPELTGSSQAIKEQLKYYADLNQQLYQIGNRLHDTSQPTVQAEKKSPPRSVGHLNDLQEINEFITVQNSLLQDTINKLTGLI